MPPLPVENLLVSRLDIVAVIDGTGPLKDEVYQRDFKRSFCRQIKERCLTGLYRRGVPGDQDLTTIYSAVYSQIRSVAVSIDGESSENALAMGDMVGQAGATFDPPSQPKSPFANLAAAYQNPYAPNPLQQQVNLVDRLSHSSRIKNYRIFLVGYSRGGSECVFLANLLQRAGLQVEAMFLFDAVNMTIDLAQYKKVPSNVKVCYHAYRNPKFADPYWNAVQIARAKLEAIDRQALALAFAERARQPFAAMTGYAGFASVNQILHGGGSPLRAKIDAAQRELDLAEDRLDKTRSNRWTKFGIFNWGNVGLEAEDKIKTRMDIHPFDGSHGALGGVPWPATMFPRDIAESVRIRDWMWKRLEAHNVFPEEKVANPNVAFVA
jgi:hypothetical protein